MPLPREIDRLDGTENSENPERTTHLLREPSTATPQATPAAAAADDDDADLLSPPRAIPVAVGSEEDDPTRRRGVCLEGTGRGGMGGGAWDWGSWIVRFLRCRVRPAAASFAPVTGLGFHGMRSLCWANADAVFRFQHQMNKS